jgi:adenylate cyclase
MKARARTLVVALALSAVAGFIGLAFYLIPPDAVPFLSRVGDYVVHQNALANPGAFALSNVSERVDPNDSLALVNIDDPSAKGNAAAGLPPFPFPRSVYGTLLQRLHAAGAKVAVFDINFLENATDAAQDRAFAAGLRAMPTILTYDITTANGGQIGKSATASDLAPFAAGLGYTTFDHPGGYFIGQPPIITTGAIGTNANQRFTSLAATAVERYTGKRLGDVPLYHQELLYLPLRMIQTQAADGTARREIPIAQEISFADAVTEPVAQLKALVNGKIVLIGATAEGLGDFVATAEDGHFPGVYVNARLIDQLLGFTYIHNAPPWLEIALIFLLPLLIGLALAELRPSIGIAASLLATVVYVEIAVAVYAYRLYWLDLIHVAGAMLVATLFVGLYRIVSEGAQRKMVTEMFGMHVSPAIVGEILKTEDPRHALNLKGTRVEATIFYSDIRGFTSMSETMTPEEIYDQLNEYFDTMCDLIFKYGGYVDKFIGDCIMAVFSAPFQTPDDPAKAVRAAVEQQLLIKELSAKWEAQGKHAFTVGMGINTGDVVMGNLGATSRMNYTVIGDNVNVAARLYNVAKGGEIVISEATYEHVRDLVDVVEMEPVMVKGKSVPIRIYNVTGMKGDPSSKL